MTAHEQLDPDRSIWHLIAIQLRRHRAEHKMSGAALGRVLGVERAAVSRYEAASRRFPLEHAKTVDAAWKTRGLFTALVKYAEASDGGDYLETLADVERRATRLRMWETSLVPGVLQTPDYARAALSVGMADNTDEALNRRTARQAAIFERPRPPYVSVVLNWVALAQPVGDAETMRAQLAYLLELADLPNVSVRVIGKDAGAHVGMDGSFQIMTVDGADVAGTEDVSGGRLVRDPVEVETFQVRYDRIGDMAMPVSASRAQITEALETWR